MYFKRNVTSKFEMRILFALSQSYCGKFELCKQLEHSIIQIILGLNFT